MTSNPNYQLSAPITIHNGPKGHTAQQLTTQHHNQLPDAIRHHQHHNPQHTYWTPLPTHNDTNPRPWCFTSTTTNQPTPTPQPQPKTPAFLGLPVCSVYSVMLGWSEYTYGPEVLDALRLAVWLCVSVPLMMVV